MLNFRDDMISRTPITKVSSPSASDFGVGGEPVIPEEYDYLLVRFFPYLYDRHYLLGLIILDNMCYSNPSLDRPYVP